MSTPDTAKFKYTEISNNHKFFSFIHEADPTQFIKDLLDEYKSKNDLLKSDEEKSILLKQFKDELNSAFHLKTPSNRLIRIRVTGSFDTFISIYPHWVTPGNKSKKSTTSEKAEV